MMPLLDLLADHLGMLALGATGLLSVGALAMLLQRSPIQRQRTGELTIVAVLVWMLLACIPLPRWSLEGLTEPLINSNAEPVEQIPLESDVSLLQAPIVSEAETSPLQFEDDSKASERVEILRQLAALDAELPEDSTPPTESNLSLPATLPAPQPSIAPHDDASDTAHAVGGVSWRRWVAGAYLTAVAFSLGWLLLGQFLLRRLIRGAVPPPQWLSVLYASLAAEAAPRLLVSSNCRRAFSCGWMRPTIMLPAECCTERRGEQLRQILLHELAHVRQGDQRGRVIFNVALPLLCLHPLYWWIRNRTYLAAELLADDWAAQHSSCTTYAGELIALVKEQGRRGMAHVGTVGIFSSPTQFYRRMEMLVKRKTPLVTYCSRRWRFLTAMAVILTVSMLSGVMGVRLVQADPEDDVAAVYSDEAIDVAAAEENDQDLLIAENEETATDEKVVDEGAVAVDDGEEAAAEEAATPQRNKNIAADDDDGDSAVNAADPHDDDALLEPRGRGRGRRRVSRFDGAAQRQFRSRMADEDDVGGGRRAFGSVLDSKSLLQMLKPRQREFLILRLRAMNRPVSQKEKQISELLTSREMSDEQVIEAFYRTVLQRRPPEAELEIVREIMTLSDDRGESVEQLLSSLGKLDDASNAAIAMLKVETQVTKISTALKALLEEAKVFDDLSKGDQTKRRTVISQEYYNFTQGIYTLKKTLEGLDELDEKIRSTPPVYPFGPTRARTTSPITTYGTPSLPSRPSKTYQTVDPYSKERKRPSRPSKPRGPVFIAPGENRSSQTKATPLVTPATPRMESKPVSRKGEKYVIVGFIDLDGDNKSDREKLRQMIGDAGAQVVGEILPDGKTIPEGGNIQKLIDNSVEYVILGDLPEQSSEYDPSDRDLMRIHNHYKLLRFAAGKHGVKIITPREFVAYLEGLTRPETRRRAYAGPKRTETTMLMPESPKVAAPTVRGVDSQGSSSDAVSIALDYSEATSKLPRAELKLARIRGLHKAKAATTEQLQSAEAEVTEFKQRISILSTVAKVLQETLMTEMNAIDVERESTKDEVQKARLRARAARIRGQLQILSTIKRSKTTQEIQR